MIQDRTYLGLGHNISVYGAQLTSPPNGEATRQDYHSIRVPSFENTKESTMLLLQKAVSIRSHSLTETFTCHCVNHHFEFGKINNMNAHGHIDSDELGTYHFMFISQNLTVTVIIILCDWQNRETVGNFAKMYKSKIHDPTKSNIFDFCTCLRKGGRHGR